MPTEFQHDKKEPKLVSPFERLSDVTQLSAHVTRILGQNPGLMTLQGTNSYLLQPPSSPLSPLILIDTSSPHTASAYIDLLITHLHHLGLESGLREVHFESTYAKEYLGKLPDDKIDETKSNIIEKRVNNPNDDPLFNLSEYGDMGNAEWSKYFKEERKLPAIEHIILTHRHLDHTGALPLLLTKLKGLNLPPPKIWKLPNPDETQLTLSDKDRPTTDAVLVNNLPRDTFISFSPFQPLHPIMPGLMISIIDPQYRHLLKTDKDGKVKWNEVPEIARVSVRCLKTPGHTQDSVSLVMCEGEKGVFTGDTVLGEGTTIFTDLSSYMTSLKILLALKPNTLYPAHGKHHPTPEGSAKHIQNYITHRQEREDQIISLLQSISFNPNKLSELLKGYFEKRKNEDLQKYKEDKEFLSGRPYTLKYGQDEKQKEGKEGEERKREKEVKHTRPGDDMPPHPQTPEPKRKPNLSSEEPKFDPKEEEEKYKAFENMKGMTVGMLCRLIYDTKDEKLIYAASRPVKAHLEKLEKDGKVKMQKKEGKDVIDMKIVEGEMEVWEIVDTKAD